MELIDSREARERFRGTEQMVFAIKTALYHQFLPQVVIAGPSRFPSLAQERH